MAVDVFRMPKLGFGLMRLPENDGETDLNAVSPIVQTNVEKAQTV